tara:strand:+ start:67 stop:264 length:198 start_codon:yes stop_codon:yes gene_type:complete
VTLRSDLSGARAEKTLTPRRNRESGPADAQSLAENVIRDAKVHARQPHLAARQSACRQIPMRTAP